jgi:hypothetical protein
MCVLFVSCPNRVGMPRDPDMLPQISIPRSGQGCMKIDCNFPIVSQNLTFCRFGDGKKKVPYF